MCRLLLLAALGSCAGPSPQLAQPEMAVSTNSVDPLSLNPAPFILANSPAAAQAMRAKLIQFIWKRDTVPLDAFPEAFAGEGPRTVNAAFDQAASVTRLRTSMEHGLWSDSYFFQPASRNGCLILYHAGHGEPFDTSGAPDVIQEALRYGCDVLLLFMPLTFDNPQPVVTFPFGPLRFVDHASLGYFESDDFNPLKYFVHPVTASLNYAIKQHGPYAFIGMAGLSGGAWTTTVYAALDTRIQVSLPVSGTMPKYLLSVVGYGLGDWEQANPGLARIASYLDMYALGTYPNRQQIQGVNYRDTAYNPTCCGGRPGEVAKLYMTAVDTIARNWGGSFSVAFSEMPIHAVHRPQWDALFSALRSRLGMPKPKTCPLAEDKAIDIKPVALPYGANPYGYGLHLSQLGVDVAGLTPERAQKAILCEDDYLLGPQRNQAIADGYFLMMPNGWLAYSASDNTDPRTNGRRYRLLLP